MIVKNLERIQRMVVQLEAIIESDEHIGAAKEFDEDDLRV